ncbi:exonuclease domain-containing protein [Streptomyces carpinensis]|uniref:Exonuclease domain-containing protein n=1 Tax=Streptomyces carpinensis TaxID=66369 RepID=A0ABV1VVR3_9ACTN|nr:exonuclease domain-containing protein [Streptomyces carpinensis]
MTRKTWLDFPLIGLDFETTGVDVNRDRVVSGAVVRYGGGQPTEVRSWRSDVGGMEIPAEATRIHKITTERARAEGRPAAEVIREVTETLAAYSMVGLPLVAMNAQFDLTLLERECERYGVKSLWNSTPVVLDPRVLDKRFAKYRRGKRNLGAICAHWGVRLDRAHNAEVDAKAACAVVWKIAKRHPWLTRQELGDLHEAQVVWAREQTQEFREYLARVGHDVDDSPFDWPLLPAPATA